MSKTKRKTHLQHPSSYQGVGVLLLVLGREIISLISLPRSLKNLAKLNLL